MAVLFLFGYIFIDTHVCSYPADFKACQTVGLEKGVEVIDADVKLLFAPLFLLSLPAFVQLMYLELRKALSFLAVISGSGFLSVLHF